MIGDTLKALRKEKGLTIAESAERFGVAPRTYSSYEAGEREPNISLINQFADFYGVTTDYLLGRETFIAVGAIDRLEEIAGESREGAEAIVPDNLFARYLVSPIGINGRYATSKNQ